MPDTKQIHGKLLDKETGNGIDEYVIEAYSMWRTGSLKPTAPKRYIRKKIGLAKSKSSGKFFFTVPEGG